MKIKSNTILVITLSLSLLVNIGLFAKPYIAKSTPTIKEWLRPNSTASDDVNESVEPNEQLTFFFKGHEVEQIHPMDIDAAKPLPEDLIISPGTYLIHGRAYVFRAEGLYRVLMPGKENHQRIVFSGDLDTLISSLSWIASHGNTDDSLGIATLTQEALSRKLLVTCGVISPWAKSIFESLGIESRVVTTLTRDRWNSYDNGHTMLEIKHGDRWVVYDLDSSNYFIDGKDGSPLSFVEFVDKAQNGNYKIVKISGTSPLSAGNFSTADGYDYTFYSEAVRMNIKDWYRRIIQVPLIQVQDQSKFVFPEGPDKERIESYSPAYRGIPESEFIKIANN